MNTEELNLPQFEIYENATENNKLLAETWRFFFLHFF